MKLLLLRFLIPFVLCVLLPFSAEAAAEAAHKIPHYGNYSYLSFTDGTNRVKGTWEAAPFPTMLEFPLGPNGESE